MWTEPKWTFKVVFNRSCCHWNYENVKFNLSIKIFHQYNFHLPSFSLWPATFLLPWFGKWHTPRNCQTCVQPLQYVLHKAWDTPGVVSYFKADFPTLFFLASERFLCVWEDSYCVSFYGVLRVKRGDLLGRSIPITKSHTNHPEFVTMKMPRMLFTHLQGNWSKQLACLLRRFVTATWFFC